MPGSFIGRTAELALLDKRLNRVTTSGEAVALALRGRRQVGKSRLIQEFCDRARVSFLFYAATKGASPVEAVEQFCTELRGSTLVSDPSTVPSVQAGSWPDALRALVAALPATPSIVVLDEVPWLTEQDPTFDGVLQTVWDRSLRSRPVLLFLLGSDLHTMERLTAYDRPFFGRADHHTLGPLNPAEVGAALGLAGAHAPDAYLASGGLPGILRSWPHGTPTLDFIKQERDDPALHPEVDLVGADRAPVAPELTFVGSIKWLESPFDAHDLDRLRGAALQVPGFIRGTTGLAIVSRSGFANRIDATDVGLHWTDTDVVAAWR